MREGVVMTLPTESSSPYIPHAQVQDLPLNLSFRDGCQATAHGHHVLDRTSCISTGRRGSGGPKALQKG